MPPIRLAEIAEKLNAELIGNPDVEIHSIAPIGKAQKHQITFFTNLKYQTHLQNTGAAAVMLKPEHQDLCQTNKLILKDPYLGFARVAKLFVDTPQMAKGIHPKAIVGENCEIANSASIGANVVIGNHVAIGENSVIHANTVIGEGTKIGNDCLIYPNVTVYHRVIIGDRVSLHSGVVIGADGFGLANNQGRWEKIPQLGSVMIGDDVEVGANTTIDRGALENTVIDRGVKIDNQVQIAHNVQIGADTAIAACVGIAGSAKIGRQCILAGKVGVPGHIKLCDQVILTAASNAAQSIKQPGIYSSGIHVQEHKAWRRNVVHILSLDKIVKRLKKLEQKFKEVQ